MAATSPKNMCLKECSRVCLPDWAFFHWVPVRLIQFSSTFTHVCIVQQILIEHINMCSTCSRGWGNTRNKLKFLSLWSPHSHAPFNSDGHFRFRSSLCYFGVAEGAPGCFCNMPACRNLCRSVHGPSVWWDQVYTFSFQVTPLMVSRWGVGSSDLSFAGTPSRRPLLTLSLLPLAEQIFFPQLVRSTGLLPLVLPDLSVCTKNTKSPQSS